MNSFSLLRPVPEMVTYDWDLLTIVIIGFFIAFCMAFAVGANDVANSFGPAVGSKVLSLKWACILAVIFESAGAIILGTRVSDTVWKEMLDVSIYRGQPKVLVYGYVSSLCGTTIWLAAATVLKIPVSGTHAIIAATVGFSLVKQGTYGIYWLKVIRIVASWFISPIFAGVVSGALFILVRRYILEVADPVSPALRAMPFFYGLTVFINVSSIFLYGTIIPGVLEKIPWWGVLCVSAAFGLITGIVVQVIVVPYQRKRITVHESAVRMEESLLTRAQLRAETTSVTDSVLTTGSRHMHHSIRSAPDLIFTTPGFPGYTKRSLRRASSLVSRNSRRKLEGLHSVSEVERSEFLASINVLEEGNCNDETLSVVDSESIAIEIEECGDVFTVQDRNTPDSSIVNCIAGTAACSSNREIAPKVQLEQKTAVAPDPSSVDSQHVMFCPYCPFKSKKRARQVTSLVETVQLQLSPTKTEKRPKTKQSQDEHSLGVGAIFAQLQIVTAIFTAFGHGGNDVCNAIGPMGGIWMIFSNEMFLEQSRTPIWLLCFGALGISCGLCILGRRVIQTVGEGLSTVLPTSGFCIGLGTAFTVLISSEIGLPISTTHCIVGSVTFVGWLRARETVNWRVLWKIIAGWAVTMPVAAGCSAAIMAILSFAE